MAGKTLPKIIVDEVIRMRNEGQTFYAIARELGITEGGARSAWNRCGPIVGLVEERATRPGVASQEVERMFDKEMAGAKAYHKVWKTLWAASKLQGRTL